MAQNRENIVVCGHYGSTNLGDEAIALSILQNLKKSKAETKITFLSYNPKDTTENLKVDSVYLLPLGLRSLLRGIFKGQLMKTLKTIRNCDKFILGGGGLFTDERLFAVFLWGLHGFFALRYKKPIYMIGQSVGPLNSWIGKWLVRKLFSRAELIAVRDSASKELLKTLGIKNEIIVLPDLVFGLEIKDQNKDEIIQKKVSQFDLNGYFVVSLREWKKKPSFLYKKLDQVLCKIVKEYKLLPVLIPFQLVGDNDHQFMDNLVDQSRTKYPVLIKKFDQNIFSIIAIIKNADFLMGMRLHSLVFSIITNTPFVGFSYSSKVKNLLKELKLDNQIAYSEDDLFKLIDKILIEKDHKNKTVEEYLHKSKVYIPTLFKKI